MVRFLVIALFSFLVAANGSDAVAEAHGNERAETIELVLTEAQSNAQRKFSPVIKSFKYFSLYVTGESRTFAPLKKYSGKVSPIILFKRIVV